MGPQLFMKHGAPIFTKHGVLWYCALPQFRDFTQYDYREGEIHQQNAEVEYFTLVNNTFGSWHLNDDALYYSSNIGRFLLPSYSLIWVLSASKARKSCLVLLVRVVENILRLQKAFSIIIWLFFEKGASIIYTAKMESPSFLKEWYHVILEFFHLRNIAKYDCWEDLVYFYCCCTHYITSTQNI